MPRRTRVRSLSDAELEEMHERTIVEALVGDLVPGTVAYRDAERVWTEYAARHRRRAVVGCVCLICCRSWSNALEA